MKYRYLFGSVVLGSLLLSGCSMGTEKDDKTVSEDPSKIKVEEEYEVGPKADSLEFFMAQVNQGKIPAPGELSVDKYDVSKYTTEEKASYYETDSILVKDELVQEEDEYLVYYFSPLCVYCNEFYTVLEGYEQLDNGYKIYKVNVDIKENLSAWESIDGTPTLKLVTTKDGKRSSEIASVGYVVLDDIPVK